MQFVVDPAGPVCEEILHAVSESEARSPTSLPPLYDVVDPDALETLCARQADGTPATDCTISFAYSDSHVVVNAGRMFAITVTHRSEDTGARRNRPSSVE